MKKNYFIKHLIGTVVMLSVLFLSAGRFDYWHGLLFTLTSIIMLILNYTLLRPDAQLLEERSMPGSNTKQWDKKILGLLAVTTLILYIVAGLDSGRYQWSPHFPWPLYLIGIFATIVGQLFFLIAQKQNTFFSSVVRIQNDRNHQVYSNGLYSVVRHPAYLGMCIQSIGFPLLFGSVWSVIPVGITLILLIIRTNLEDSTLQSELSGYADYVKKTRYKLIPFIW